MFPLSIRYGIPLLIVVFTAVLAYTVQKEWGAAEAVVRGEGGSQIISRIAMLQKQFSHAFATGDRERIAQGMSLLGSRSGAAVCELADDTAILLGATKGQWVGRSLAKVAPAQWPRWPGEPLQAIIDRVRAELSGELFLVAGGRYVLGIYPVRLDARGDGDALTRCCCVFWTATAI